MPRPDKDNTRLRSPVSRSVLAYLDEHGSATLDEVARALMVDRRHASVILSRLVKHGELTRIGRGVFAASDATARTASSGLELSERGARIAAALRGASVPAQLTGLDVLVGYSNQLSTGWPTVIYAARGAGEWAADVLVEEGAALVNPLAAELKAALQADPASLVVVRERTLRPERSGQSPPAVRDPEDAWVDLAAEARHGYPIGGAELAMILAALAADPAISWTRLVRAARRRGEPLRLARDRHVPVEVDAAGANPFWSELASVLKEYAA